MLGYERRPRPVCTMLTSDERLRVDAAGMGHYRAVHRDRIADLIEDVTQGRAEAVLLSVMKCQDGNFSSLQKLIAEARLVPTIGLMSHIDHSTPAMLVQLGKWGVSTVIDVRSPNGWMALREYIVEEANDTVERIILRRLRENLGNASDETFKFFEVVLRTSRTNGSIRTLCGGLGILPSTLMSRFFRAGLPAPKRYLASARLIRAAYLFQNPGFSIANVANHLQYSSPQSFGRHVRIMTGMSALSFRKQQGVEETVEHFLNTLVLPFERAFETFDPLGTLWCRKNPHLKRAP